MRIQLFVYPRDVLSPRRVVEGKETWWRGQDIIYNMLTILCSLLFDKATSILTLHKQFCVDTSLAECPRAPQSQLCCKLRVAGGNSGCVRDFNGFESVHRV